MKSPPPEEAIRQIRPGMTEDRVLQLAGEPDLVDPYAVGKYIFYYPSDADGDCVQSQRGCLAVVFAKGRVVSVKQAFAVNRAVSKPTADRLARAHPPKPAPQVDPGIRREIERLEGRVRQIPASRTLDNLRIYRRLLKLDPENVKYQKKVAVYEEKFRKGRRLREEVRKLQNEQLGDFEGNDQIQIALKIIGEGRFYVWVKNVGSLSISLSPDQFFLVCRNGRRYACYRCQDLEITLDPGESTEGRLSFNIDSDPAELTLSSPVAGTISKIIPEF
jgi:hypothetical protein